MYDAIIITPVKDSIETTISTIESIVNSTGNYIYIIYDDFSTKGNTEILERLCTEYRINLIDLKKYTSNPSPNYLLVLQLAQSEAIKQNLPLIIVESDVQVKKDTIKTLVEHSTILEKKGLIGCVTQNESGQINFPYTKFRKEREPIIKTKHSISFCCTLLSTEFLKSYDFKTLKPNKHWYDISISRKSVQLGFNNYLMTDNRVIHKPHSSRPWKLLKYENPIKYYLNKILRGLDKI